MLVSATQRAEILTRIMKRYHTIGQERHRNPLQSTYYSSSSLSFSSSSATIRFPGAMPVSLMREDIIKLYNGHRSYVFLIKSDGLRVLLYFDRMAGVPFAVSINRRLEVSMLNLKEEEDGSLYDGTLWDCEAMSDGSYQVFDNVLTNGLPCGHYDFVTRMLIVRQNLWFFHRRRSLLTITDKPFYSLSHIRSLFDTRHAFPTDGIIAMPVEDFVYMGHCPVMFKIKRRFDNTIDCLAVRAETKNQRLKTIVPSGTSNTQEGTVFELWVEWNVTEETYNKEAEKMAWNGATYVCWAYTWYEGDLDVHRKIVECRRRSDTDSMWRIHLLRPDKMKPNMLSTALRTCRNIDENLTYETVFPHLSAPLPSSSSLTYDQHFLPHLKRHEKTLAR